MHLGAIFCFSFQSLTRPSHHRYNELVNEDKLISSRIRFSSRFFDKYIFVAHTGREEHRVIRHEVVTGNSSTTIMKSAMDHGDYFFVTSLRARSSGASLIACVEGSLHFSRAISLPDFVNDRFTIRLVH
jgi:hypothetical protein